MSLTKSEKSEAIYKYLEELCILLPGYEIYGSTLKKSTSKYLCPIGKDNEITYFGKPEYSFRAADHWSWYTTEKKCSDSNIIQCNNISLPPANPRLENGGSKPRSCKCVAFYKNGVYQTIYGDVYNRILGTWGWLESDPKEVLACLGLIEKQ